MAECSLAEFSPPAASCSAHAMSADEREIYDRQIRLWGIEAQNKIRNASVLIVGLTGAAAETAKNLMLAGVKELAIIDDKLVTEEDKQSNYLLPDGDVSYGQSRVEQSLKKLQALNPNVRVAAINEASSVHGISTWSRYSVVIVADEPLEECVRIDAECRAARVGFVALYVFGSAGAIFFDFNEHRFQFKIVDHIETVIDDDDGSTLARLNVIDVADERIEKRAVSYPSMRDAFSVDFSAKRLIKKARFLAPAYYIFKPLISKVGAGEFASVEELRQACLDEVGSTAQDPSNFDFSDDCLECYLGSAFVAACAIIGGFAAQEAIKAISENFLPIENVLFYDPAGGSARINRLPPR